MLLDDFRACSSLMILESDVRRRKQKGSKSSTLPRKGMFMRDITLMEMLKAGVHFGHKTSLWNPKMKEYIFTTRNNIHIFDFFRGHQAPGQRSHQGRRSVMRHALCGDQVAWRDFHQFPHHPALDQKNGKV